jgi:hypothetical protein
LLRFANILPKGNILHPDSLLIAPTTAKKSAPVGSYSALGHWDQMKRSKALTEQAELQDDAKAQNRRVATIRYR